MASQKRTALLQSYTLALIKGARLWRQLADAELTGFGISEACAYPLVFVARLGDGIRQSVLAEAIGIEGPSLVRLLDQLCTAGLVERREDATDKRAKTLHLTAKGAAVAADLTGALDAARNRVYAGVSNADIQAALRVLRMLDQAISLEEARLA
jgi:MarR family transcriptional regulator, transcriptional regulator for hemolysin